MLLLQISILKLLKIWAERTKYIGNGFGYRKRLSKRTSSIFHLKKVTTFCTLHAASARNQEIEAFWSRLKIYNLPWWIDFFSDLMKRRIFNPGCQLYHEALIFSCMPIIQAQLNYFVRIWNIQEIRQSSISPGGVPEIFFNVPSTVGFDKKGSFVDDLDLRVAQDISDIKQHSICKNDEIYELFICIQLLISRNWKFHVTRRTLLLFMLKS